MLKCSQSVQKTRLQHRLAMAEPFFCPHQGAAQVSQARAAQVFQLPPFEQVPDVFLIQLAEARADNRPSNGMIGKEVLWATRVPQPTQ